MKNNKLKWGLNYTQELFKNSSFIILCFLLFSLNAFAQKITITGQVKDSSNEPIVGVSIIEKGMSNGTMTNLSGNFSIAVSTKSTLVISSIGYKTQEVVVKNATPLKIVLQENTELLDEVVVVGYGSVKRKDVTTSVAVVSTKDLDQRPIVSAASAIQGKAAGVNVIQPNGEPGSGLVVRIRGNSSINASNDPLYVVDGVPMTEINFLSPNDIESMQILKDASSAAIYGSRASNGVVLITTKSGSKGEAKISFAAHTGITQVSKQMKSLNISQYKDLMKEIGSINIPDGLKDETDWFKETYRTGITQNYQLSISKSIDKLKYYISGGYTDEGGVIKVAYYKRYNFRANIENQIRSWLKVNANLAYSDYTSNGIISGEGANKAGVILSIINTPTYAKIWDDNKPGQYYNNFYGANVTHPIENMSRTEDNKSSNNRLLGSMNAEISFSPRLKFKSSVSIDRIYNANTSFLDPLKTEYGRSQYGSASDKRSLNTVMVYDNILTYDLNLKKHNLNLMAGTSGTTSMWSQTEQTVSKFLNGDIKTLNAGNKVEQGNGTLASHWAIMSYVGRMSYNYDSKYLVTANLRADGSSKLAPGSRWGYFPSVSAAWRLSSESFLKDIHWIDDLKLRGGWGQTGNQSGVGDYGYLQRHNFSRQNWWETGKANALPIISPANMSNNELTWETTTQSNIGVDLTVLNNRLTFIADAYYKRTTNLLMDVPLGPTASFSNIYRNEGEMENKGFEFAINSKNLVGNFKWDTDFNISFNRNKVLSFDTRQSYFYAQSTTGEYITKLSIGKPLGMFYGYISDGVNPETGDIMYRDIDKSGKLTPSDKTYIGNPNPDFTFGLTNNFSYKGFNLNVFFQGSVGNDIYNLSRMETEGMYDAKNQSTSVLNRWRIPGQITDIPRSVASKDNLKTSSRFVEDGSFIRLKSLTLSYNVTGGLLKKWNIGKLQPYFTAQNLFTITKYKGFDPEINQWGGSALVQGLDWGTYPQVKSFVFGINVEF